MSWRTGWAWAAGAALAGSIGFAATRADRGDKNGTNPPAPPLAAAPKVEEKRVQLDPELATALYRVGLQPESLAAAGVASSLADDVVAGVKTWLADHPTTLKDLDQRYFDAITSRDKLVRLVRSGLASAEQVAACQKAAADFDATDAERKATLDAVFDAGAAVVSAEQKSLLARVHANQAKWNLPLEYLVVDRTEEEWIHVRAALANERISLNDDNGPDPEDPDPDDQAYLSTVRAETAVAAAKTNLDTTLGAVKTAWEAAAAKAE